MELAPPRPDARLATRGSTTGHRVDVRHVRSVCSTRATRGTNCCTLTPLQGRLSSTTRRVGTPVQQRIVIFPKPDLQNTIHFWTGVDFGPRTGLGVSNSSKMGGGKSGLGTRPMCPNRTSHLAAPLQVRFGTWHNGPEPDLRLARSGSSTRTMGSNRTWPGLHRCKSGSSTRTMGSNRT